MVKWAGAAAFLTAQRGAAPGGACWLHPRRAGRVNPLVVIRTTQEPISYAKHMLLVNTEGQWARKVFLKFCSAAWCSWEYVHLSQSEELFVQNAIQETRKEESLVIHDKGIMSGRVFSYGEVIRMRTSLELGHLWLWIYWWSSGLLFKDD